MPSWRPKLEPFTRSVNATLSCAPQKYRGEPLVASSRRRSGRASLRSIFVQVYEFADGRGKVNAFRGKRIDPQLFLKAQDQNGKAQRIKPGIRKHCVDTQRSQLLLVLRSNPFHL